MSEMGIVERVARVINERANLDFNAYMLGREESFALARAAIAAMRDLQGNPLIAAYDAAARCGGVGSTTEIKKVWAATIDAALAE